MESKPNAVDMPMLLAPTRLEGDRALREARRLFARALAAWASDALTVRRQGVDRLAWTGVAAGRAA